MKVSIDVTFVIELDTNPDGVDMPSLSPVAFKQLMLGSTAEAFELMFRDMLMQVPQMLKAEVTDVEEYDG